jgi:hypothetical protein
LDITTERFGFFNPLALDQIVIRPRHRAGSGVSTPRQTKHEWGVWQRRFGVHAIQDQRDYEAHLDYAHFNPVKHGWVARVADIGRNRASIDPYSRGSIRRNGAPRRLLGEWDLE